jgi:hypothetical protein
MATDRVGRYLQENDCLLVDNRIYNLVYGRESEHSAFFAGARFGLLPGQTLQELEQNLTGEQELDTLVSRAIDRGLGTRKRGPDNKVLAYEIIQRFSMKDVLHPRRIRGKSELSIEDKLQVKNAVMQELKPDTWESVLPKNNLLFLGGYAYGLFETDLKDEKEFNATIDGVDYTAGLQGLSIEERAAQQRRLLLSRIRKESKKRMSRLSSLPEVRVSLKCEEFYYARHNLGFKREQRGTGDDKKDVLYLFTKIPGYILWEHKKDNYFRFPPATVAVEISLGTDVKIGKPVVFGRYKHPALPTTMGNRGSLCVQYIDTRSIDALPLKERAVKLLETGCRILMVDYCSDGHAYKNLEEEEVIEAFSDCYISKSKVDKKLVTNLGTCMHHRRGEWDT